MKTPNLNNVALALAMGWCVTAAGIAVAAECTTSSPGSTLTGVFSVMDGGKITVGAGGCNVHFYGTNALGVASTNLTLPEASPSCSSTVYDASGNATTSTVTASNTTGSKRTLDTYVPSTATAGDKSYNSSGNYTLPAGEYGTVSISNGASLTFTGAVKIHKLSMSGCNSNASGKIGVTFADSSVNYIDQVDHQAQCDIQVATGSGTAVLNVLGTTSSNWNSATSALVSSTGVTGFTVNSGPTCVNIDISSDASACKHLTDNNWLNSQTTATKYALMNAQHPERLQINVYNGDFVTQGDIAIAAGIYVNDGSFSLASGTPTSYIGEVLAKSITAQNNAGDYFFYKATSMDGSTQTVKAGYVYSSYSLAMAYVTPTMHVDSCSVTKSSSAIQTTDGYAYVATQRDGETSSDGTNVPGISGDLVAYHVMSDGSYGTQTWSAAAKLSSMISGSVTASDGSTRNSSWRAAHMFTNDLEKTGDVSANFVTLAQSSWASSLSSRILSPTTIERGSLAADAVFGRPWRTSPTVLGSSVIFATEDGFLYSIDQSTGVLNWGWMPYHVGQKIQAIDANGTTAAKLAAADALMNSHPWGQVSTVAVNNKYYITGSALGGALHFAIQTNSDGNELVNVAFYDYRSGKTAPGGAWSDISNGVPTTGWPFGGAAPTEAVSSDNAGKVAYIVGNSLIVRNVDGSGTTLDHAMDTMMSGTELPSSNLIYWNDNSIHVGSSARKIHEMDASAQAVSGIESVDLQLPSSEPIFGLNGSFISSSTSNAKIVLAQTKTEVSAATYNAVNGSPKWGFSWYTKTGGSGSSDTAATVPSIPASATITALPAILPASTTDLETVMIPYTLPETLTTKCIAAGDASTTGAYTFGPLLLASGKSALTDALMGVGTSNSRVGLSVRTGDGEATGVEVVTYVVQGSCGATGTYIAAQAAASGRPKSFYDYGTSAASANVSKPNGNETHFQAAGASRTRLNWRELTNFF